VFAAYRPGLDVDANVGDSIDMHHPGAGDRVSEAKSPASSAALRKEVQKSSVVDDPPAGEAEAAELESNGQQPKKAGAAGIVAANGKQGDIIQDEERATGTVGWQVYREFIRSAGGVWVALLMVLALIGGETLRISCDAYVLLQGLF